MKAVQHTRYPCAGGLPPRGLPGLGLPARAAGVCLLLALHACRGGDSDADGWFEAARVPGYEARFSADVAKVYGVALPPHWCRHVAAVAARVFAGEWELADPVPHSPLNCELPLALPGEPQVRVELAPYFVFDRARTDVGGDAGLRVGGAPAFFPDPVSVSVSVHGRMALTVSMAEVAAAAGAAGGAWQAWAVRLAEALLAVVGPAGSPASAPPAAAVP